MGKTISILAIFISGLFPLIGTLWFNWDIQTILFLYWAENIIAGFWNIYKMRIAELPIASKNFLPPSDREYTIQEKNSMMVTAFVFHFSFFSIGHGVFLKMIFLNNFVFTLTLLPAIAAMFLSYGTDYFLRYVKQKEYKLVSSDEQMKEPYVRLIIMHLVIILGSLLILNIENQNVWPLIILVTLKIGIDLATYQIWDKRWLSRQISFN